MHNLPSIAGKRRGRAIWPYSEDTDYCGKFKSRSDVESEPERRNSDEEAG
jgi:hypothetical protein